MKYLDFVMLIVFPILFITLFGYIGIIALLFNLGILKYGVEYELFINDVDGNQFNIGFNG